MGCLRSLFCENSGVDPDGSQKSVANCQSSAECLAIVNQDSTKTHESRHFSNAKPCFSHILPH